ncbi:MAG TPA: BACON domain-containing carbohydrate-binding protein [Candidatus Sulfopaludibacter sp.]|nr:BACON domain-containing carbohydrate-binding protein [Candidatus Sulfopaludibacter sp.]
MRFFLLLAAGTGLFAQTCTYSPNPPSFNLTGDAFSGRIFVGTQRCLWTATTSASWIHITNAQNYAGSQTVYFDVDQNTTTAIRSASIVIGDAGMQAPVRIIQTTPNCGYLVGPASSAGAAAGGGNGTFQVTSGCIWYVNSGTPWISVSSPTGNVLGNATVSYTVAANGCVAPRSGIINVGIGQGIPPPATFTVNQDGSLSNLTFSPAGASYSPAAANGRVNINTGIGCSWSGYSDASWLQITANSGAGYGPGAIVYSVAPNVGPARTGHITIGTQVFTVTQSSSGPPAPVLSSIVNGASFNTGAIAPGEFVSLFGSNMGPAAGAPFGQNITTSLAGVQVMFGAVPAPLTYVSATQINAVVPYGVAGNATTQVQVQYQGQSSSALSASVQPAAPAIFSADLSGHGPGAILNTDFKLNTSTNPASAGSVVMIYGTGGGVTSPASSDGSLAPMAEPFPRLMLPVTVSVGGIPAQVTYSGGSPGLVDGLTQFNVVIPSGVTPGPSVPVLLQVGGYQSQPGLTIAIQ